MKNHHNCQDIKKKNDPSHWPSLFLSRSYCKLGFFSFFLKTILWPFLNTGHEDNNVLKICTVQSKEKTIDENLLERRE